MDLKNIQIETVYDMAVNPDAEMNIGEFVRRVREEYGASWDDINIMLRLVIQFAHTTGQRHQLRRMRDSIITNN